MAKARKETQAEGGVETVEASDFTALLNKEIKPKSAAARDEVGRAVQTLAEQALSAAVTVAADVTQTVRELIAELDKRLTEQVNHILHNEEFRQIESAWRGLHYLVNNTESDENLKVRVCNASK